MVPTISTAIHFSSDWMHTNVELPLHHPLRSGSQWNTPLRMTAFLTGLDASYMRCSSVHFSRQHFQQQLYHISDPFFFPLFYFCFFKKAFKLSKVELTRDKSSVVWQRFCLFEKGKPCPPSQPLHFALTHKDDSWFGRFTKGNLCFGVWKTECRDGHFTFIYYSNRHFVRKLIGWE